MSVTSIERLWDDRGGESEGASKTTATRSWLIKTNSKNDTEQTVFASGLLPSLYAPLPENGLLTARKLTIRQKTETPYAYVATCFYSSEPLPQEKEEREDTPDPLDRRAKITWNSNQYTKVVHKDIDGDAIVNSAGDYFIDPAPEIEVSRWTATVTKNLATIPSWILDYADAVNSGDFEIGGITVLAKKARIVGLSIGDLQKERNTEFYPLSITMEFRKEGWRLSLLDQGYYKLNGSGLKIPCVTKDGIAVTAPVMLDGDGGQLTTPSPANAQYIEFKVYDEKDFTVLPLV